MLHAILLLQLAAPVPQAPPDSEAKRLVHASISDFELGFFDRALHEAEEAYRLDPLPQILFNIGQCHRALKQWEQAELFYQRYLARLPEAPNRRQVESLIIEAQYRLKTEQLEARTKPLPAPLLVVTLPSPFPTEKAADSAPAAAVEGDAKPPHSHTAGWVLGSVALASLAVAIVGIVEVGSFEALEGRLSNPTSYTQWVKDSQSFKDGGPAAASWEAVAIATGAVALGSGTAAAITW